MGRRYIWLNNGNLVVKTEAVLMVQRTGDDRARITLDDGATIVVNEPFDQVRRLLTEASRQTRRGTSTRTDDPEKG